MEKGLLESERIVVASLILIIFSLLIIAKTAAFRSSSDFGLDVIPEKSLVAVQIQGAVARPGEYRVPIGTELKKVLSKAKLKKFANLRQLDFNQTIREPISFEIAELQEIKIQVDGAVKNSLFLVLPIGSRVCDLKEKISLEEWATPDALKSRRMLLDGEVFTVPGIRD